MYKHSYSEVYLW